MTKIKYIELVAVVVLLVAVAISVNKNASKFGAIDGASIQDLNEIDRIQSDVFALTGKYVQMHSFNSNGTEVVVEEYVSDSGVGYIVRERKTVGDHQLLKISDHGNSGRSEDWKRINPPFLR